MTATQIYLWITFNTFVRTSVRVYTTLRELEKSKNNVCLFDNCLWGKMWWVTLIRWRWGTQSESFSSPNYIYIDALAIATMIMTKLWKYFTGQWTILPFHDCITKCWIVMNTINPFNRLIYLSIFTCSFVWVCVCFKHPSSPWSIRISHLVECHQFEKKVSYIQNIPSGSTLFFFLFALCLYTSINIIQLVRIRMVAFN